MEPKRSKPESAPRRSLARRLLRALAWTFLVLLVGGALAYWAREPLLGAIVRQAAASRARALTGLELSIDRIEGDWWSSVELVGVRLDGPSANSALRRAAAERARVEYDWAALWRGDPDAIRSIDVDGPSLLIDVAAERAPTSPAPPRPIPWPAKLPAIAVERGALDLRLGDGRAIECEGLAARGGSDDPLRASASSVRWIDAVHPPRTARAAAMIVYDAGRLSVDALELDGQVAATALRADLRDWHREALTFSGVLLTFGGTLDLRGAIQAAHFALFADARDVDLALVGEELAPGGGLAGRATLLAQFDAPMADLANWRAQLDAQVLGLALGGRVFDFARGRGRIDCAEFSFDELELHMGANRIVGAPLSISRLESDGDRTLRTLIGVLGIEVLDPKSLWVPPAGEWARALDRVREARVELSVSGEGLVARSGRIESDSGSLVLERGRFRFGALDAPWYEGLGLDLELSAQFDDLAPLGALFGTDALRGALSGQIVLRGPALAPEGECRLVGQGLSVFEHDLGAVDIVAHADRKRLRVERASVDGPLGHGTLRGAFEFATGELADLRVQAGSGALDHWTRGAAQAAWIQVDASLSGPWRDPSGFVRADAACLEYAGRFVETLELETFGSRHRAVLPRLIARVDGVDVDAAGRIDLDAAARDFELHVDRARLAQGPIDLALEAPAGVSRVGDRWRVDGLCVTGSAGRATVDVDWSPRQREVRIEAAELYPMRLFAPFLPAGLSVEGARGSLSITQREDDPAPDRRLRGTAELRIDAIRLFEGAPTASAELSASLTEGRLRVDRLVLDASPAYRIVARGSTPFEPTRDRFLGDGEIDCRADVEVGDLTSLPLPASWDVGAWTGGGTASLAFAGDRLALTGAVDVDARLVNSDAQSAFARSGTGELRFRGRAELGDGWRMQGARIEWGRAGGIDVDARLGLGGELDPWLRLEPPDVAGLPLELDARMEFGSLSWIAALSPRLRRTDGTCRGRVQVAGNLREPRVQGEWDIEAGELRVANGLSSFDSLRARVEWNDRKLDVRSLQGRYSAAPFDAAGSVDFATGDPRVEFRFTGQDLLLARSEGLRLRADADLAVRGPIDALVLSGKLELVEGRFSRDVDWLSRPGGGRRRTDLALPFLREEPWASLRLDVELSARKPVRVENNLVRGTLDPRLSLRGSGSAPILTGRVFVGPTRVKLPATNLEVGSGVFTFASQGRLVPQLDLRATTRVRGYDVVAQVGGDLDEPEVSFSSSPPLASEDLAVLVLTGQLPESALTNRGGEAAAQTVAVYLGRDLLTRWLGAESDGEDPLAERIEFTQGAEVSQTGNESTEVVFRLTPMPRGKSRLVYLRAEKDVHEKINFGVKFLFRFQ